MRRSIAAVALCCGVVSALLGQSQSSVSEAQLRLDLKRAQVNEAIAADNLAMKVQLYNAGLASRSEFRNAQAEVERAKLDTQRANISLSNELPSFRIISALKSIDAAGSPMISLELQELPRGDVLASRSYLVSILAGGTTIGFPYQRQLVVSGDSTSRRILTYRLLRDADEIVVVVTSGTRREEVPILLQRERAKGTISMTSPNFSQEGLIGDKVEYAIRMERFAADRNAIQLRVVGLPAGFSYEFTDPDSKAKINLLRFADAQNSMRVQLRVFLPGEPSPSWLDKTIPFGVDAVADSGGAVLSTLALSLRPTGAPKLVLSTDNLMINLRSGEQRTVAFVIENTGGADARDVTIDADTPVGFSEEFKPPSLTVASGQHRTVQMILSAGGEAIAGEYAIKLRARTKSRLAEIDSPDQSLRVVLGSPSTNIWVFALIGGLLCITAAAVLWMMSRTRR